MRDVAVRITPGIGNNDKIRRALFDGASLLDESRVEIVRLQSENETLREGLLNMGTVKDTNGRPTIGSDKLSPTVESQDDAALEARAVAFLQADNVSPGRYRFQWDEPGPWYTASASVLRDFAKCLYFDGPDTGWILKREFIPREFLSFCEVVK